MRAAMVAEVLFLVGQDAFAHPKPNTSGTALIARYAMASGATWICVEILLECRGRSGHHHAKYYYREIRHEESDRGPEQDVPLPFPSQKRREHGGNVQNQIPVLCRANVNGGCRAHRVSPVDCGKSADFNGMSKISGLPYFSRRLRFATV